MQQLDCRDITRLRYGTSQRDGALKLAIVVLWRPLSLSTWKADRAVFNGVIRVHSLIQSQGEDKWLKRRAGLTKRLRGPVELALVEVVTAYHGFHSACGRVERHK